MHVDCNACRMKDTHHCDDCLVTAVLHPPEGVVEIDDALEAPLRALATAGLIPVLRFRPRDPDEPASETG